MKHQLDFEKPIIELQNKLEDLRKHPDSLTLGLSFDEEIKQIEAKIEETRRQIFLNLNAWQRVQREHQSVDQYRGVVSDPVVIACFEMTAGHRHRSVVHKRKQLR